MDAEGGAGLIGKGSADAAKGNGISSGEHEAGAGGEFILRGYGTGAGVNRFDRNGTCVWSDIAGDGDCDLILAGSGTFLAVYRNDGGKFVEVTGEVGLAGIPSGYSLNLVDYDNDGKLDLYVSLNGWSGPLKNTLYRNLGGKFVDVSAASGADDGGDGFVSF